MIFQSLSVFSTPQLRGRGGSGAHREEGALGSRPGQCYSHSHAGHPGRLTPARDTRPSCASRGVHGALTLMKPPCSLCGTVPATPEPWGAVMASSPLQTDRVPFAPLSACVQQRFLQLGPCCRWGGGGRGAVAPGTQGHAGIGVGERAARCREPGPTLWFVVLFRTLSSQSARPTQGQM